MTTIKNSPAGVKIAAAVILLTLSVLFMFSLGLLRNPFSSQIFHGLRMQQPAPEFLLTDLDGRSWQLADLRGQFVYLMFGYLNCEDVCHSQALVLSELTRRLPDEQLRFVYVAIDPQRDTPQRLKQYFADSLDRVLILNHPNPSYLQSLANAYKAPYAVNGQRTGDYLIQHAGFVFLIDPHGDMALLYPGQLVDLQWLADDFADIKKILIRGNDNV